MERALKILFLSAEMAPFAQTGGLGDVAESLPKAVAALDDGTGLAHDVRVAMPRYRSTGDARYVTDFPVDMAGRATTAVIRTRGVEFVHGGRDRSLPVYFVDNYHYFDRDRMYMYPDEAERFAFFCRAALEMLPRLGWQPDVIHCNDWQTGPVPLLLKASYADDSFYKLTGTLFTIHNLEYQGNFAKEALGALGLGEEFFTPERIEFYGTVSFMKAGILYGDVINTVSRTYAREIQGAELGEGMDGVLRVRSKDLHGIVNGIDYEEFNPRTDPRLYRPYDSSDLSGKQENKRALQEEMGLPVRGAPVLGIVSRLVGQKGLDLVVDAARELMAMDVQLVVLGSGDPYYERMFRRLEEAYPGQVKVTIAFNTTLAQRIYAGSDIFLMPSRFEPCGLGQLIAMRYGALPVVHATGGLADTVQDYDPVTGSGTGFVFSGHTITAFLEAVRRALHVFRDNPAAWEDMVHRAMEADNSWKRSAADYLRLYQEVLQKSAGGVKMGS